MSITLSVENKPFMLSVFVLSIVMLNVVAPIFAKKSNLLSLKLTYTFFAKIDAFYKILISEIK